MYDEEGFRRFAESRQKALLRSAYLLCGDWHAAEDLVQTAFGQMFRTWRRGHRAEYPDAYARQVLYRAYVSSQRKKTLRTVPLSSVPEPVTPSGPEGERLAAVTDALAQLPPRARAVIVLRFWDDYSVAQTAEALHVSQGTVKSQTSRALSMLRGLVTASMAETARNNAKEAGDERRARQPRDPNLVR